MNSRRACAAPCGSIRDCFCLMFLIAAEIKQLLQYCLLSDKMREGSFPFILSMLYCKKLKGGLSDEKIYTGI